MPSILPVERSVLARPRNSSCDRLVDVDVFDALAILVVLHVQRDDPKSNRLSLPPTDALEGEDGLGRVGECFVLNQAEFQLSPLEADTDVYHRVLPRYVKGGEISWDGHA